MQYKKPIYTRFAVIERNTGREIEISAGYYKRPFSTKVYKQLLKGLESGKYTHVITGPAPY
jgi:hypothetical protein